MHWYSALAIYFVTWWITLFAVLPWRVRTQGEAGEVVPGTPESAPVRPPFLWLVVTNSIVAAVVLAIIWCLVVFRPFSFAALAPISTSHAAEPLYNSLDPNCRFVRRHVPAADVAAEPGKDAKGRPVAPADLPSAQNVVPPMVGFNLKVPVDPRYSPETSLNVGHVEVDTETGDTSMDGVPIEEQGELVALCPAERD